MTGRLRRITWGNKINTVVHLNLLIFWIFSFSSDFDKHFWNSTRSLFHWSVLLCYYNRQYLTSGFSRNSVINIIPIPSSIKHSKQDLSLAETCNFISINFSLASFSLTEGSVQAGLILWQTGLSEFFPLYNAPDHVCQPPDTSCRQNQAFLNGRGTLFSALSQLHAQDLYQD